MTPEYMGRIRIVYEEALSKSGAERGAFLDEACQGDSALRQQVELLFEARERVPDWLNGPVLAAIPPGYIQWMIGRELSGYKLIREIGRGGMGSVYLAERSDGAFVKQVAVKLIQLGIQSSAILARFRQEREILASLDHPGIARLLDAGTTVEGLPYFVMEFVNGQPIDRWCDEHKLNVTERLKLFRQVFDAVQYAHQRLIVHRDLKPGNILVTAEGTVKLLDFGIAKIVPRERSGEETTRTLLPVMTPEYASPEQLKGESIGTLSDVYSLGVVLYELLTGHRPHHVTRAAMREMARVLTDEEPVRPSLAVLTTEERLTPEAVSEVREGDPGRLRKRLEGDLDWILLTALHAEPVRRYRSVESFGQDLGRHLESRPVAAREDSLGYRASRFIRRHPSGVASAALILLSIFVGLGATIWESRIAIGAAGSELSGPALFAPQWALFLFIAFTGFALAVLLTHARLRRVLGAWTGGAVYAAGWLARMEIGFRAGWWHCCLPGTSRGIEVFAQPAFMLTLAFAGGAILLAAWRIARRFGWLWEIAFLLALGFYQAVRERIWFDRFMYLLSGTAAPGPLVADAALLAIAVALGYAAMRLISGGAEKDKLAHPAVRLTK